MTTTVLCNRLECDQKIFSVTEAYGLGQKTGIAIVVSNCAQRAALQQAFPECNQPDALISTLIRFAVDTVKMLPGR